MKPAAKRIVDSTANILNKHLAQQTPIGKLIAGGGEHSEDVTNLVNEILKEVADGTRLVTAVETSGELLGFVPRAQVPIPEQPHPRRPPSPEESGTEPA